MDLIEKRQQLQRQADSLAIEESNLAEQIENLRGLERRAIAVNRQKHQIMGALAALDQISQAQATEAKDE